MVSTMCPTMSRTSHSGQAVLAVHVSGTSASLKKPSDWFLTTPRTVSLPSYVMAFQLIAYRPFPDVGIVFV